MTVTATPYYVDCQFDTANLIDIGAIRDLQGRNLLNAGGSLSVEFSFEWFKRAIHESQVVVARKSGRIVGYLVVSNFEAQRNVPIIRAMSAACYICPDAYIYGPVCVDETERGRGLAAGMFAFVRKKMPDRKAATFIRVDNARSLRAHIKMGMSEVARFSVDDVYYVVFAYNP